MIRQVRKNESKTSTTYVYINNPTVNHFFSFFPIQKFLSCGIIVNDCERRITHINTSQVDKYKKVLHKLMSLYVIDGTL